MSSTLTTSASSGQQPQLSLLVEDVGGLLDAFEQGLIVAERSGQLLFYEPGVGTSPDERVVGGAFGYGLSHNVRSCYRFLAESYEPGDNLFLFGFSRGAYTARSLAGLVRNCGILLA